MLRRKRKSHRLRNALVVVVILAFIVSAVEIAYQVNRQPSASATQTVLLETSMGNITIELYGDMPMTSGNFKNLVSHGVYDGTIFHRVVHDFVVQGGDASSKGINVPPIRDELPNRHSNLNGTVGMANTGAPNSATSQFYINLKDNPSLDGNYTVFGKVTKGIDVVKSIGGVETDSQDKPLQDITLIKAQLVG